VAILLKAVTNSPSVKDRVGNVGRLGSRRRRWSVIDSTSGGRCDDGFTSMFAFPHQLLLGNGDLFDRYFHA